MGLQILLNQRQKESMAEKFTIHLSNIDLRSDHKSILKIDQAAIPIETITCIVGSNGSGKTSLLKSIAGLNKITKGSIEFPAITTCMVHNQSTVLKMSVKQNLMLLRDVDQTIQASFVDDVMAKFQLIELSKSPAPLLSTGEKQRLALARAYLLNAQLILLDEPTSSLDNASKKLIENFIIEMTKEGTKFLIVSHDLPQVQRLSEHVVQLENGQIRCVQATHRHFEENQSL
ncbi:tungstate transport system ATP-binding protein [Polynucleobacter kasalickyi]|uniref:Tungstate transport system ATP-binding protein n=2 Tax=Polynucleobacter kasalickyi TaxID=1938817 RepID=A0A1W1ZSS7_9BURK|nr:tungstate transport system ATP-binding protein [Polynucleobacter kasalickyi]